MKRKSVLILAALLAALLLAMPVTALADEPGPEEPAPTVPIFVKVPTGKHITLQVHLTDLVETVKAMIEVETGTPAGQIVLIFTNREMEDGHTLQEYNVQKDSTLHMVLRITYTVTFQLDGGSADPALEPLAVAPGQPAGDLAAVLTPPEGLCGLEGWYNSEDLWDLETDPVTEDITLCARWREHVPDGAGWQSGNGRHYRVCETCGAHLDEAACAGGAATCTAPAVCDVCGQPYGEIDAAAHTGSVQWTDTDGESHAGRYDCCGAAVTGAHVWDGEGVCQVCGALRPAPAPEATAKPETTAKPAAAAKPPAADREESARQTAPATGDGRRPALWLALLAACGAGLAPILVRRRERGD